MNVGVRVTVQSNLCFDNLSSWNC